LAQPETQPLALTMGDPAGIGLEITLRAWCERQRWSLPPFALLGDPQALAERAQKVGLAVPITTIDRIGETATVFSQALPVLPVPLAAPSIPGKPDPANAKAVISAIEMATTLVCGGEAGAIVTNPIAKSILYGAGFSHPGHTEFLAALAERYHAGRRFHPVMMLACDELRVVPLTVHIPVATVPASITAPLIVETGKIMASALSRDFGIDSPRIAVAGLNPHAGEAGTIGTEDRDLIAPAVAQLKREGFAVTGPHSADTLFHAQARKGYDAVLCMYHDQALIPIKTLAFDTGVNVTLGLPFVRTSPDHGTAFDIAGRGIGSPDSLIAAIQMARDHAANRAAGA
jgi:4-hydroxythreonine-4-phosphate dehydrogenase